MKIEEIKDPKFLKKLKKEELEELAKNIRKFLIDSISKTGGHLSSNLGIVDLTIAIHKTFDSPKDKIIFDVGHQAYTHKILTGRANKFDTLRQFNGLSGFQKRNESLHDSYEAGHSSTSLSACLGFAISRDLDKKKNNIIAVIGDGSIGNGLAYEALNHIGSLNTKLIVILNDNEMSISKNVGAIHNTLDKIRTNYKYEIAKTDTKGVIGKVPYLGKKVGTGLKLIKESFKKIYMKEGYLFEELGLDYFGPINGHDYDEMLLYLELAKKRQRPVLLHVITEKGKGYKYAEEDIEGVWHGIAPFDKETGKVLKKKDNLTSWSEIISNHLINIKELNNKIIAITPAMANGSKLNKFKEKYPKHFIDVGIAEEHALVLANAIALSGKKPFVSIYSTFLQRGYDQINQDIARMDTNVVIGIDRAGIVGDDGETHQGIYDIALLSHIPNMIIMAPSNSVEAGNMLYTAFNINHPVAIRYSRAKIEYKYEDYKLLEIGKWDKLKVGTKGTIISYGDFLNTALLIGEELDLNVVNSRFIKPFDIKMFKEILNLNTPIFIYEESSLTGSLGSILSTYAINTGYTPKMKIFAINDIFVKQGNTDKILEFLELDYKSISKKIKNMI
ncbi:MAG: 1-deoxy-D-xylulose-5-phosphate synthase [Bacilli bacterium]